MKFKNLNRISQGLTLYPSIPRVLSFITGNFAVCIRTNYVNFYDNKEHKCTCYHLSHFCLLEFQQVIESLDNFSFWKHEIIHLVWLMNSYLLMLLWSIILCDEQPVLCDCIKISLRIHWYFKDYRIFPDRQPYCILMSM